METLPDYLAPGLDIVFIGINPGEYSASVGRYFARRTNRFWPALNASGLLSEPLDAESDHRMLEFGMGFTDVVKRPTTSASDLRTSDFRKGAQELKAKLEFYQPLIACFQGLTGYKNYLKHAEGVTESVQLGLQERTIGATRIFVVPNPSPANASYSLSKLVGWLQALKGLRDDLKRG